MMKCLFFFVYLFCLVVIVLIRIVIVFDVWDVKVEGIIFVEVKVLVYVVFGYVFYV